MKFRKSQKAMAAFTLMELMISGALMALILTAAYLCLSAGFSAQKLIDPRVDAAQTARVVLGLIAADLRSACLLDPEAEFLGMDRTVDSMEADNVDFATHNFTPRRDGEGDYCQVSYYVDQDKQSGEWVLWRRRNPAFALNPLAGGRKEELARGVRRWRLEYYDGLDWYDTWGDTDGKARKQTSNREQYNLTGMPEAVRVTLSLEPPAHAGARQANAGGPVPESPEPVMTFQTVARLQLAARASAAGGSGSGGSSSSEVPPNGVPSPGGPGGSH